MPGNMMVNKALKQKRHENCDFHNSRAAKSISGVGNFVMPV
jgi:hypothetical protein